MRRGAIDLLIQRYQGNLGYVWFILQAHESKESMYIKCVTIKQHKDPAKHLTCIIRDLCPYDFRSPFHGWVQSLCAPLPVVNYALSYEFMNLGDVMSSSSASFPFNLDRKTMLLFFYFDFNPLQSHSLSQLYL